MRVNITKYLKMLENSPMSKTNKIRTIRQLWKFIESQVDQAFNLHPVQQVLQSSTEDILQSPDKGLSLHECTAPSGQGDQRHDH